MFEKLGYVTTLTLAIAGSTGVGAEDVIEEVVVIGQSTIFANNQTDEAALATQSPVTSALAIIDNLPGVSVQEGDTCGFDDWSTTVSIRGFQLSLSDQQIGTTNGRCKRKFWLRWRGEGKSLYRYAQLGWC